MSFAEIVAKRMEEEAAKEATGASAETAAPVETQAPAAQPQAAEADRPAQQAEAPTGTSAELQTGARPTEASASAPSSEQSAADRKLSGPVAALRAERAQRQAAERQLAEMRQRMTALEQQQRFAPQPQAAQPAAQATPKPESPEALIQELLGSDDELQQRTGQHLKALVERNAKLEGTVTEIATWQTQQKQALEAEGYKQWSDRWRPEHVPGMPEWMFDRLIATKPEKVTDDDHLSNIVLQWHEFLEKNPAPAVAAAGTQTPQPPARPASAPPPRVAAPSTPPASTRKPTSMKDVYAAMEAALSAH